MLQDSPAPTPAPRSPPSPADLLRSGAIGAVVGAGLAALVRIDVGRGLLYGAGIGAIGRGLLYGAGIGAIVRTVRG